MISKPPELGSKEPEHWIREFVGYFEKVRFEFLRVGMLWFPCQSTEQHDNHAGQLMTAAESGYISAIVPRGTQEIKEALVRLIPTTTGTIDWTANVSFGKGGQDENARSATKTEDGKSVTDDQITEIDVTSIFAEAVAEDQVGLKFTLDAVSTTTNVYLLGLALKTRGKG